jgi:cyclase
MVNRRQLLQLSARAGVLLGSGLQHRVFAQPAFSPNDVQVVQNLNPTTVVISGTGCNVLAKKAGNGDLLVVDGGLADNARDLRGLIEETLDSRKFTMLMNTHWHPEQTGLNAELGNRDVTIFAHENTRQWLSTRIERPWEQTVFEPLPATAQPSEIFYHYGSLPHGSESVEYGYMRQAHTDGDMYVFLPADNVLHTGGVINSDSWPLMDWWTGGWIGGLVDGIETLLSIANDSTVIVPANGPVMTKAELTVMRDMYAEIFGKVRELFMKASNVPETLAAKPAGVYEAKYGNSDMFIELSHWSLIPHYTPDA